MMKDRDIDWWAWLIIRLHNIIESRLRHSHFNIPQFSPLSMLEKLNLFIFGNFNFREAEFVSKFKIG